MLNRIAICALAMSATLAAPPAAAQATWSTADTTNSSSATISNGYPTQDRLVPIPIKAKRADMEFNGTQIVLLDGKKKQMAPGVRIYGADNMLKLAASLKGTAKTKYVLEESTGLLHYIWILTPREIATPDPKIDPATGQPVLPR